MEWGNPVTQLPADRPPAEDSSEISGESAPQNASTGHWQAHPFGAIVLRSVIIVIPLAIASLVGLVVGRSIGGVGVGAVLTRVFIAGVVSLLTFVITERASRRFLPLAMLLKLSLVFPDQAPSRFAVALRSTSINKLQQWAKSSQVDEGPAALAEKVVTLATALNAHDRRTRGHSDRSRAMAELIATEMGLTESEINEVRWGAFLHDIGKILVPAALLNKAGRPTASEWETLKRHPGAGGELVEPLRAFLGSGIEAVSGHHENFDGTGYPRGLAGPDIALAARIVSVADSFEVMTAVRAYKKPMKAAEAREELARNSGTQFDPVVVRALLNVSLGRLHWLLGMAAWAAEVPFLTVIPRVAAQAGTIAVGPTVTIGALSSVAAVSLGTAIAPAAFAATPVSPHQVASSAVAAASPRLSADSAAARTEGTQAQVSVPSSATASSSQGGSSHLAASAAGAPSSAGEPAYSANAGPSSPGASTPSSTSDSSTGSVATAQSSQTASVGTESSGKTSGGKPGKTAPTTEPASTAPTTKPAPASPTTKPASTGPTTEPASTGPTTEPASTGPTTEPAPTPTPLTAAPAAPAPGTPTSGSTAPSAPPAGVTAPAPAPPSHPTPAPATPSPAPSSPTPA
jgi:HD domain